MGGGKANRARQAQRAAAAAAAAAAATSEAPVSGASKGPAKADHRSLVIAVLVVAAGVATLAVTWFGDVADARAAESFRREDGVIGRNSDSFAVVGYVPEWRYGGFDWASVAPHYTHLIFFSLEVDADGNLAATDRLPPNDVLAKAHEARAATGCKLMLSFGGNARTNGFPQMVASRKARLHFITEGLIPLMVEYGLDGLDMNWEYPNSREDWVGLFRLLGELRSAMDTLDDERANEGGGSGPHFWTFGRSVLTMAFYPSQEVVLAQSHVAIDSVDYFLMMSYDQPAQHSTWSWVKQAVRSAKAASPLPWHKIALGVPFYGRDVKNGDWVTYGDILRDNPSLDTSLDELGTQFFNGADTIGKKTEYAWEQGLGGVMVWEAGQDAPADNPKSLAAAMTNAVKRMHDYDARGGDEDDGEL